jgi:N-acetylneuraminic acid mutarotase
LIPTSTAIGRAFPSIGVLAVLWATLPPGALGGGSRPVEPATESRADLTLDGSPHLEREQDAGPGRPGAAARSVAGAARSTAPHREAVTTRHLPPLPDPHGFAGAFAGVHNRHLIAAGGANFPDGVMPWDGGRKVWHDRIFALALDDQAAGWKTIGRLPAPNAYGVSLTTPGGVLLIGGSDDRRHLRDVRLLTLDESGSVGWRSLPPLPSPLAQMAGALVGRDVHVAGGIAAPDATTALTAHYQLNLDRLEDGWRTLPPLPGPGRILPVAAAAGGAFYVFSGCALTRGISGTPSRTYLRDAWKFANGRWTRLADLPRPAAAAASPAPADATSVFVISGDDGAQAGLASPARHAGFPADILRYDTARDTWGREGRLDAPAPVTLPTAPWRTGFILVNGEIRPGVRTRQVLFFEGRF